MTTTLRPRRLQPLNAPTAGIASRATGNEPGWRLDIGSTELTLLTNFGQTRLVAATPIAQRSNATM